jgi:hypothetical protein
MTPYQELAALNVALYAFGALVVFVEMLTERRRNEHMSGLTILALFVGAVLAWWLAMFIGFLCWWRRQ